MKQKYINYFFQVIKSIVNWKIIKKSGIVNTSNSLKGCSYKYGGSFPEGFDCSVL